MSSSGPFRYDHKIKVRFEGAPSSSKTATALQLSESISLGAEKKIHSLSGIVEFPTRMMTVEGRTIKFDLEDLDPFSSSSAKNHTYYDATVFAICVAMDDIKSYEFAIKLLKKIQKQSGHSPIAFLIVGTKSDILPPSVTKDMLDQLAKTAKSDYVTVSALSGEGIEDLLVKAGQAFIRANRPAPIKRREPEPVAWDHRHLHTPKIDSSEIRKITNENLIATLQSMSPSSFFKKLDSTGFALKKLLKEAQTLHKEGKGFTLMSLIMGAKNKLESRPASDRTKYEKGIAKLLNNKEFTRHIKDFDSRFLHLHFTKESDDKLGSHTSKRPGK